MQPTHQPRPMRAQAYLNQSLHTERLQQSIQARKQLRRRQWLLAAACLMLSSFTLTLATCLPELWN